MILPDVNVLVGVFHSGAVGHDECLSWFREVQRLRKPYCVSMTVLSSVVRIATNPKAFSVPAPLQYVLDFCSSLLDDPCCRHIEPGRQHLAHFSTLCIAVNARGNLVTDAWIAALALEHGCTVVTFDRDFRKFPGLKTTPPLIAG